jgi:copper homeostasis protein
MISGKKIVAEVAVFTPESALVAANAGADRIELCSGYSEGGLSPAASTIKLVRNRVQCKFHVMIRPRIGDFVYSRFEKEIILEEIEYCKSQNVDGIVVGALTKDALIDTDFMKVVVARARPMSVTFHRAFDQTIDMFFATTELIACGVDRILTSGGKDTALEGMEMIDCLVRTAGNRIIIVPGGGLTPQNVRKLVEETQVSEVHFSGKELKYSKMNVTSNVNLCSHSITGDYHWFECNLDAIKAINDELSKF